MAFPTAGAGVPGRGAVPLFTADTTAVNAITVKGYMYISNVFTYFGLHDRARLTLEDGWSLVTQV
ncbi:hypothetical protein, partial [uncultured Desulfovibrio sp.]|uniref:hypothetical protein n=1 Tax=uncultured Desulfovibrio sp. TaxID=167968 RepID=UPI002636DADF